MEEKILAINLMLQHDALRGEIESAIRRVFQHQAFILGPEVGELEEAIAKLVECPHAVGCASGSDALLLCLLALGIEPGDRVLVPAFSFFATAGSVARAGAMPVFVDIDPRTFNLRPDAVEAVLRSQKPDGRRKAMFPVHLYGQCADMEALTALAKRHNLFVVEDAAQSILARYQGRPAGSLGVCGCFSFFPTKNLGGVGDGGMITTRDATIAERLRALRVHGAVRKYVHAHLGINSRLDTLQAAILLVKLRYVPQWTEGKKAKASFYERALQEAGLSEPEFRYPTAKFPIVLPYRAPEAEHVYHQFTVRTHRRDELAQYLAGRGIETSVYYPVPLHLQPAFSYLGGKPGDCPEAERAAAEVLSLPIYPEITAEQQVRVVDEIRGFYSS